jgi:hypothetical protein
LIESHKSLDGRSWRLANSVPPRNAESLVAVIDMRLLAGFGKGMIIQRRLCEVDHLSFPLLATDGIDLRAIIELTARIIKK